ncbi:MAG: DUF4249 domain-containing protein [Flavisolibacter sp.]
MLRIILLFLFFSSLTACRDEFDMELKPSDKPVLVVDGILNAGIGPTTIKLSQSTSITDPVFFRPISNAFVNVEASNGTLYPLSATGNGNYIHTQLPLVIGEQYRLNIRINNREYQSDFVEARRTPEIDSISWKKDADGMLILASSHDASNQTRYYKWDFDETWEIRSNYAAMFEYISGTTIVPVQSPVNYRCWKYSHSTNIMLGSSAQLQSDVINEATVHFIENGSEKLSVRYSMLLRQQSITRTAHEYFTMMRKNTESIGSIFDPQPTELKGNIRSLTDPTEGVIGFVTASNITQKRIFITAQQAAWSFIQSCLFVEVANNPSAIAQYVPEYLPWTAVESPTGVITAYYMSPAFCVDCRKRGGDLGMPGYW